MAQAGLEKVLAYLRKTCAIKAARDLSDAELMRRFVTDREEAAFSALVRRHGPMVLSVCRRVLSDIHSAEDAFQATFLVLVRRIASLSRNKPLAGWLYGVAQRIALRARTQQAGRRDRERQAANMPRNEPLDDVTWQELRTVLDEEIGRLPEKYRTPIVLCYFEGKTHDQAARELGYPKRTLTSRLSKARDLLRTQLSSRGITLSSTVLAAALAEKTAGTAVGAMLTINTVKAAMTVAAGKAVAGGVLSAQAIILAEEGMKATIGMSGKVVALVLTFGLAVGGAGLAGYGGWQERVVEKPTKPKSELVLQTPPKQDVAQKKNTPAVDIYGDPLPEGAMARLGTTRFRAGQNISQLAFTPNDKILAAIAARSFFYEGGLWIWDSVTGRALQQIPISDGERSIAISPDGKTIFVGRAQGGQNDHRLVDITSGKVLQRFELPDKESWPQLHVVTFSPDGKTVAAGGGAKTGSRIFFWDVASGKVVRNLTGDAKDYLLTMAFSPDGKFLATGGVGKIICIWDLATERMVRRLDEYKKWPIKDKQLGGGDGQIDCLSFGSDGRVLASFGQDWIVRLWDFDSGEVLHRIEGDQATMRPMALSKDGRLVATGKRNGSIQLWDATTGKEIRAWQAHLRDINILAFSNDGSTLASSGQGEAAIRRWDTGTGKEVGTVAGHTGAPALLLFAADGKSLQSFGRDGRAIEWNLNTLKDTGRLYGGSVGPTKDGWHVTTVDLSPDGKTMMAAGTWWTGDSPTADPTIRFFEVTTGKEIQSWQLPENEDLDFLKYSPDGSRLVSVSRKGGVRVWDLAAGKVLQQIAPANVNSNAVAWSPDSKLLAFSEPRGNTGITIAICDIGANKELRRWASGQWHIQKLSFTPDGKAIVSTSSQGGGKDRADVRVWAADTGALLASFSDFEEDSDPRLTMITSLGFSPNGRVLAVAVFRKTDKADKHTYYCKVHLFDLQSKQDIRKFDVPQGMIWSLAFGVDGRILATGAADSAILLWDLGANATPGDSEFDALWSDLAGDAPKADKAIWNLAAAPKASVPMLKERMLFPKADAKEVAKLLSALESDRFADREQATQALDKLGESAEAAVRKHMEGNITLEVRQRLQQFLDNRNKEVIRKLRAIEVLEHIATADARQLLDSLAKESPNPRVAEAATSALSRLAKRS